MQNIKVKTKVDCTIVTHTMSKKEQLNNMELDIINKNEIPALLPVNIKKTMTGGTQLRFEIRDMTNLESFLQSNITFGQFIDAICQIADTLIACEAHGIPANNLEMLPKHIFYDYPNKQVRMMFWPLISLNEYREIGNSFQAFGGIYHCSAQDDAFRNKYLSLFQKRARFDILQFKKTVNRLETLWIEEQGETRAYSSRKSKSKSQMESISLDLPVSNPVIHRATDKTTIVLKEFPFTIGRSEECDYVISGNAFIGRVHLTLFMKDGDLYLKDHNSVNGTFVNGKRIPGNTEIKLSLNDEFALAEETFTVVSI
ncbi:MAG: FHA domain-containing protein [Lachnospiraceae bacterium]|nr:FHA domain-containing protein [Lachnospiraceae bacterium]